MVPAYTHTRVCMYAEGWKRLCCAFTLFKPIFLVHFSNSSLCIRCFFLVYSTYTMKLQIVSIFAPITKIVGQFFERLSYTSYCYRLSTTPSSRDSLLSFLNIPTDTWMTVLFRFDILNCVSCFAFCWVMDLLSIHQYYLSRELNLFLNNNTADIFILLIDNRISICYA